MDIDFVHRLAQTAHDNANEAQHTAEKASMSVQSHELICAERYKTINEGLSELKRANTLAAADSKATNEKFQNTMDHLKSKMDKASGVDMAFRYVCLFLGAVGVVWGMMHGVIHVG